MKASKQNPQEWLPVGQRVMVDRSYNPKGYDEHGNDVTYNIGRIAVHLANGAVAVKFDGYFAEVDYSANEARKFSRIA